MELSVGILRSRFDTYPPQQFDLTVLEEDSQDVLDTPIILGDHVVASGPRTLQERIESDEDWSRWLTGGDPEEDEMAAKARETAKAWVDSLVGEVVDVAPK